MKPFGCARDVTGEDVEESGDDLFDFTGEDVFGESVPAIFPAPIGLLLSTVATFLRFVPFCI